MVPTGQFAYARARPLALGPRPGVDYAKASHPRTTDCLPRRLARQAERREHCRFGDDHNLDVNLLMDGDACPLRCRDTHFVRDVADSKALNQMPGPAVILSASGMLSGGRILHHLKWRLPDARNAVLFVGYQAKGTRGRALLDGARSLRIHGQEVPVRAHIARIDALSGHADQDELIRWLGTFTRPPQQTFLVHGEPSATQELGRQIHGRLGWSAQVPEEGVRVSLA